MQCRRAPHMARIPMRNSSGCSRRPLSSGVLCANTLHIRTGKQAKQLCGARSCRPPIRLGVWLHPRTIAAAADEQRLPAALWAVRRMRTCRGQVGMAAPASGLRHTAPDRAGVSQSWRRLQVRGLRNRGFFVPANRRIKLLHTTPAMWEESKRCVISDLCLNPDSLAACMTRSPAGAGHHHLCSLRKLHTCRFSGKLTARSSGLRTCTRISPARRPSANGSGRARWRRRPSCGRMSSLFCRVRRI